MYSFVFVILTLFYSTNAAPQQPEINDQFEAQENTTHKQIEANETKTNEVANESKTNEVRNEVTNVTVTLTDNNIRQTEIEPQESISCKIYKFITEPLVRIVYAPKVNYVLRNIGTCIVNGAMDLISHYLPSPFIPLIASAAGLVIPFEPIVMLKQRMPVTSYRRAFQTALSGFMNTFDKYKVDDEFDPYMTRRFNTRFMNDDKRE